MIDLNTVAAVVGALTGVVALLVSYLTHHRVQTIKSLDLRVELRKQIAEVTATINELPDLLTRSRKSRDAVLSALGTFRTGHHEQWKVTWAGDLETARGFADQLPSADDKFLKAKPHELEQRLLDVHALGLKATRLRDKYLAELASDDRDRDHLRASMCDRVNQAREGSR